ncbi:MAG: outer membrane protein assembly factor, partial [Methylophilales bacterium 16-45-7]
QGFYPLSDSTQFLGRLEVGLVSGSMSVPATYLFRAGGDQSVRGYGFQSLGVKDGDATLGGRVLLVGSTEVVQWLTNAWGAAAFIDFGNAANSWRDYEPAYGYGLGVRWKSPVGPVGADIAYGEATKDYRLHFNLGVSF